MRSNRGDQTQQVFQRCTQAVMHNAPPMHGCLYYSPRVNTLRAYCAPSVLFVLWSCLPLPPPFQLRARLRPVSCGLGSAQPSCFEHVCRAYLLQISEVSRRLMALHSVLGGGNDIDTVWMVVREPLLLAADPSDLMRRLMAMRVRMDPWAPGVALCLEQQGQGGCWVMRDGVLNLECQTNGLCKACASQWLSGDPHVLPTRLSRPSVIHAIQVCAFPLYYYSNLTAHTPGLPTIWFFLQQTLHHGSWRPLAQAWMSSRWLRPTRGCCCCRDRCGTTWSCLGNSWR